MINILIATLLAAQGGSISGIVTTKASAPRPVRVTMDQRVCGNELPDEAVVVNGVGQLANAVITLVGLKGRPAPASGIMNEKCRFSPRVQIVRPNATITTSSKDPILHTTNAVAPTGKTIFNIAVPVPGINITKPLGPGAGLVRLVCNTHPWMRGYVVVTDDYAVITGADGTFTLTDVPAGTYELRVWHETLKGAAQKIMVAAGQSSTVNFELQ